MPEECMVEFLDGDSKKCIEYLIRFENMTPEEAERVYRDYRTKLMRADRFFFECSRKERNKRIGFYVRPKTELIYCSDEEIAEMYNSGMTVAEIEMEIGRSTTEIRSILKRLNIELRPPVRMWSSLDDYRDTIIKHLKAGRLVKDIAEQINANPSTLFHYIRRRKLRELIK